MNKLPLTLFAATLSLALAALFASAQTSPKTPAKPSTQAPATAAPAAPKTENTACACCGAGDAAAHGEKHGGMHGGGMMDCSMQGDHGCAGQQISTIANIKVETTKLGATLQLIAKNASDAEKVQKLARELADHMSAQPAHAH
jgi:hypothetical protein